jgi:polyisoprenoid-binding protein YceI
MRIHQVVAVLLLAGAARAGAQPPATATLQQFNIGTSDAIVEFRIPFMFTEVRGRFDRVGGTLLLPGTDYTAGSVSVVIAAASINTGLPSRDEHLKSDDFFDADRYPAIVFQSRRIARTRQGYVATGPLTMHGVTREVSIPFRTTHPLAWDTVHWTAWAGFEGHLRLSRRDFGILGGDRHNSWFDRARSRTVPDSVDVTLHFDATREDWARRGRARVDSLLARTVGADGVGGAIARYRTLKPAGSPQAQEFEERLPLLADALLARGRASDAVALRTLETEIEPRSADAHAGLGLALVRAGRTSEARTAFRRALELDRYDTRAMEWLRRLEG